MRPPLVFPAAAALLFQACRFGFEVSPSGVDGASGGAASFGGQGGAPLGNSGGRASGGAPGSGGTDPACQGWLDDAFIHRRRISFSNERASEALDDFTVLIELTAQNFDYSQTAPFGADVRFFDSGTGAPLAHHIDTWNEGSISTIWVRVPTLEANNRDHVWIYYGGDNVSVSPSGDSYDGNYRAVWHMSESSGDLMGSTSAEIALSWMGNGTGSQEAAGQIGLAIEPTDGDGATSLSAALSDLANHTITCWARLAEGGTGDDQYTIFSVEEHTTAPYPGPGLYVDRDSQQIGTWADGTYQFSTTPANQLLVGEWAFVAMRADTSSTDGFVEVKVNGGEWETVYSGDTTTAAAVNDSVIQVGTWIGPGNADFDGRLDEIQVSQGIRSDDWVDAQYRSQANLGLVTVGAVDTCP